MAGGKKRTAEQIADEVRAKVPKKSTVADDRRSPIPTAKAPENPKLRVHESPFEYVRKKKSHKKTLDGQAPKNDDTNPPIPVKSPKRNTEKRSSSVDTPKKKLFKSPENIWEEIKKISPCTGTILDCSVQKQNDSLSSLQRNNLIGAKKLRALVLDASKKQSEIVYLKEKLTYIDQELSSVKKDLVEEQGKNIENINRYKTVNQKFIECEKNYDNELAIIKASVEKKSEELKAAQSRIAEQDLGLIDLQQTNRELGKALSNLRTQLDEVQVTNSEILEKNAQITQDCQAIRVEFENMTAQKENCEANNLQLMIELDKKINTCAELEERNKQLTIESQKVLSKVQSELKRSDLRCVEQQRLTDQAAKDLELARNEINTFKTLIEEKDRNYASLENELKELTSKLGELIDINENYDKELSEAKLKHLKDMEEQANAHEIAILKLKGQLNEASLEFKKVKDSSGQIEKKNLLQVSELQDKINEMELEHYKQEQIKKSMAHELQIKTQSFEEELRVQKDKLSNQIQDMKNESLRTAVEIQTIKDSLMQKDVMYESQLEKFQSLSADHDKLKSSFANLQEEKEKLVYELSDAKLKFIQDLKAQEDTLNQKVKEMELEIKKKENEIIEMERQKDNEMAVLQFKMNRINSVIDQPVQNVPTILSGSKPQDSQGSVKIKVFQKKRQLRVTDGFMGSSNKCNTRQQRLASAYLSDFESDESQPLASDNLTAKKAKISAFVKPQQDDLFDSLKKST